MPLVMFSPQKKIYCITLQKKYIFHALSYCDVLTTVALNASNQALQTVVRDSLTFQVT